jgi:hypothetical protein
MYVHKKINNENLSGEWGKKIIIHRGVENEGLTPKPPYHDSVRIE